MKKIGTKRKIISICILGILIMSTFGAVALNSDVKELSEIINNEVDNVADSEIAGFTHTILGEYVTVTWCSACKLANEALKVMYAGGYHPFYYVTLVNDKNVNAFSRSEDYNCGQYMNWLFLDGGYQVSKGRDNLEYTMMIFNSSILYCGEREVPDIDVHLDVIWLENATMDIEATVNNNEEDTYEGTIRVYVAEIISSMGWADTGGNLYSFAFLDYAFNENISIPSMDTWSDSIIWDGHNYNDGYGNDFGNITSDNIMVVAAVSNSEWHQGFPTNFDAYWVDDTTGFMIGDNNPPDDPSIDGTTSGEVGVIYNYTFVVTDPNGDDVTFCIDWGDDMQGCYGPYASSEEVNLSHTWDKKGTYAIKAKAADIHGAKSGWTTFEVTMSSHTEIEISGGLGVNAVITNTGDTDVTDVEWSIIITGGLLGLIDKEVNGTIPIIESGDSVNVKSGMFFGFDKIAITVKVDSAEETVDGKQFIIFTKVG